MRLALRASALLFALGAVASAADSAAPATLSFERDVRPILRTHCLQCHGEEEEHEGSLDLRLRRLAVAGGDSGPAIVPGNREQSLLFQRLRDGEMPPRDKKPTAEEIERIGRWIDQGAPTTRPEPAEIGAGPLITDEDRTFWSFQPIRAAEPPQVRDISRVRNPIDAFVLAKLAEQSLSFSSDAEKLALLRRTTVDLTGLPPTREEVALFMADDAGDAYDRLLDRLLASPHYGERWGRHWLDVAGYADSDGYNETDTERKHAYRYRDYVIQSLNADKPWDELIVEQLAGDELAGPPYDNLQADEVEQLTATGFLRMAADGTASAGSERAAVSNQVVADTLKIVSSSFLGLTVACAQCHDHRYDPISQADYYRLRAVFEPAFDWKQWRLPQQRLLSLYTDADRARAREIEREAAKIDEQRKLQAEEAAEQIFERELAKIPAELHDEVRAARAAPAEKRTPEQRRLLKEYPSANVTVNRINLYDRKKSDELQQLANAANKVRATKPAEGFVQALWEVPGRLPPSHLFVRGDHEQPKQELTPGELAVLASGLPDGIPIDDPSLPTSGRRLAYARWLTSGQHPLTARVLVNRVWMHHFGGGIVATPADFGVLGERPTHPELLDWLANDFMAGGWRLKRLHKLIMTSTAYRQSSARSSAQDAVDPDNRLYGRKSLVRLDAEALRDSILASSGKLNPKMFGPAVPVMADLVGQFVVGIENLNAGRPGAVIPLQGEEFRRSLYIQVRRTRPLSVLTTFDAPAMEPNCEVRPSSTVAPQSLMLMNNDFIVEQAEHFARRIQREAGSDRKAQASLAWQLAIGREPAAETLNALQQFLAEQAAHFKAGSSNSPSSNADAAQAIEPELQALSTLGQAIWSSNEFLYVE